MGWIARSALVLAAGLVGAALGTAVGVWSVEPGDGMVAGAKVAMGLILGGGAGLIAGGLMAWRGTEGLRRGALWMLGPLALAVLAAAGWRVIVQGPPAPATPATPPPATATEASPDGLTPLVPRPGLRAGASACPRDRPGAGAGPSGGRRPTRRDGAFTPPGGVAGCTP